MSDTELTPAGFIIADEDAIFGVGPTQEAAWADLKAYMKSAHMLHLSEVNTEDTFCPKYWHEDQFTVLPATAALLADVEKHGGGIGFAMVQGIACTEDEESP